MYLISLKYYQNNILSDERTISRIDNESDFLVTLGRNEQFEGVFQEFSSTIIFIQDDMDWIIEKHDDYLSRLDSNTRLDIELFVENSVTLEYDSIYFGRCAMNKISRDDLRMTLQFDDGSKMGKLNVIQDTEYTYEKNGLSKPYEISANAAFDSTAWTGRWSDWALETMVDRAPSYPVAFNSTRGSDDDQTGDFKTGDSEADVYKMYRDGLIYFNRDAVVTLSGAYVLINIGEFPSAYFRDETCVATVEQYITIKYDPTDASKDETIKIIDIDESIYFDTYQYRWDLADIEIPIDESKLTTDSEGNVTSIIEWIGEPEMTLTRTGGVTGIVVTYQRWGIVTNLGKATLNIAGTKETEIFVEDFDTITAELEASLDININTDYLDSTDYADLYITTDRGVKGLSPIAFNIQFNSWFNSLKSFMGLSLRYEDGTIYLQNIDDAYDESETIHLGTATSETVDQNDKIFDRLITGNSGGSSAEFEYGNLEFNAQANYSLGIDEDTENEFTNTIRVDGATINKAAIDYDRDDVSEADTDEDKDIYLIEYDPNEIIVKSKYILVSGVDTDKYGTPINLPFCKSQQLHNHRRMLAHLFTGYSKFTLTSWDKNKNLVYKHRVGGAEIIDTPEEITSILETGETPLFGPRLFVANIPLIDMYSTVKDKPNVKFSYYNPKGELRKGFLYKTDINPLADIDAEVQLIESYD